MAQKLQQRCQNNSAGNVELTGMMGKINLYVLCISFLAQEFKLYLSLLFFKVPSCISSTRLHASNPNLSSAALASDKVDPESLESAFDVAKLQEDFCRVAASCE